MHGEFQTTISDAVTFKGIGVHTGAKVSMVLIPAEENTGIVFHSKDSREEIAAKWNNVISTTFSTVLSNSLGYKIGTVEHLMSALRGLSIDNVIVDVNGPELPILDGSAGPIIEAIDQVGIQTQNFSRHYINVLKEVRVESDGKYCELLPFSGTRFELMIDFPTPVIGQQQFSFDLTADNYRQELAQARTFGFLNEAKKLRKMGFQLGASLKNSVAISDGKILNPEGIRWTDEFVRHKTLDAIGDLALAGLPINGLFKSHKGGHFLNIEILKKLFRDPSAYEIVSPPVKHKSKKVAVVEELPSAV